MQKKQFLIVSTFVCSLALVLFQNCSKSSNPANFSQVQASATSGNTEGTGAQPYDGKIYLLLGALCPDGTQVQAKISLKTTTSAVLTRKDCQDINPVALTSNDFQLSSTNSNELIYQNQTYVASSVSAVGAGYGISPKLSSPIDPTVYGAKGDGVTDNTAAFTAALAAGDILIPDGNYLIKGTISVPAGRQIQCASLSTVRLNNPVTTTAGNSTFQFTSSGGSLSNCYLSGANALNANGSALFNLNTSANYIISIVDSAGAINNVKLVNNIFENCHGDACIWIDGTNTATGVSNSIISYNTFRNCGNHGLVIDGGTSDLVSYNHITDCSMTVRNDSAADPNFNNIFEYNYLTVTHGTGNGTPYLSGGTGNAGADFTSNIVRFNTVIGNGSADSIEIVTQSSNPAQYTSNTCTSGCLQK